MNNLSPKIYVACLAAYNSEYLHGKWLEADHGIDVLFDEIKNMLAISPVPYAEEFAIHDYEGFGDLHINEYTSLQTIANFAEFISEHGELGSAVLAHTDGNIEEAQQLLDDCYHGEHNSEEDFAYYWTHEVDCREIPEFLQYYIDYKAMARDFFINDFFSLEVNRKVHVFSHR